LYNPQQSSHPLKGLAVRREEMKPHGKRRGIRHTEMKKKINRLSQRYVTALRRHLKQSPRANLRSALGLGRQAVAMGLETLELAYIHSRALAALELSGSKNGLLKRAEVFFAGANAAIEETHCAARQARVHLSQMKETLGQRTEELADLNRQLQRSVVQRKVMEDAFAKSGQHHNNCLEESLELQKRLRQLTHRALTTQEEERKKISRELQDEIAQTLLGINVRLLSLKQRARGNTKNFKNEISSTQQLVAKSARSMRQVASEIGHQ
jgi:signal transduction histidine kinase